MKILILVGCLTVYGYGLWRIRQVQRERMRVLLLVSEAAQDDIANKRSWAWRYNSYATISFMEMLFSTRPVGEFYRGFPCTEKWSDG